MISPSPYDMFHNNPLTSTKSNATVASHSHPPKATKLPPNAKVVGNYLLGTPP
jgi:hypothetical protein